MKEQEIEKLREKLGSDYSVKRQNGAITVELVDIWRGVEFASHIFGDEVYRVSEIVGDKIWSTKGTWFYKKIAKPSTESAYVEQLKAKAKELYGEIKDGDRFELDGVEFRAPIEFELRYVSEHDKLVLDNYMKCPHIYKQGKWAKKVERVKVDSIQVNLFSRDNEYSYVFRIEGSKTISHTSASKHLAQCLEDYLNKS